MNTMNFLSQENFQVVKSRPEKDLPSSLAYFGGMSLMFVSSTLLALMAFGSHISVSEFLIHSEGGLSLQYFTSHYSAQLLVWNLIILATQARPVLEVVSST